LLREDRLESALLQGALQGLQVQQIVVDQQAHAPALVCLCHVATFMGSWNDTTTPGPSDAACIDNVPPRRSTVACDNARPIPSPSGLLVRNNVPGNTGLA